MKNIKEILEKVYTNKELRKSIVPLFIGDPGLGKTVLIEEFAKEKGVNLVELITSQMSPFEISGIAMPDKDLKKMTYYNFDKLENLKDGDILFFDELLNGNHVVLNACLTILEQRKFISGRSLPNIMIIAAANPQGMSPLTPQIKERFIWYDVKFSKEMWLAYMVKKYHISLSIGARLAALIKNEEFITNNFNTPRSIDKAVNMIIHDVSTPYAETIEPILSELIKNPFNEDVKLSNNRKLKVAEMISWLDLIRLKLKLKIEPVKIPPVKVSSFKLPEKWFITTTKASNGVVKKWLIGLKDSDFTEGSNWSVGNHYCKEKGKKVVGWLASASNRTKGYTKITFKQFKEHVVN